MSSLRYGPSGRGCPCQRDAVRLWLGGRARQPTARPTRAADYGRGYSSDYDGDGRSAQADGFAQLSSAQFAAVRGALDAVSKADGAGFSVEGFTNLSVSFAGAGSGAGRRARGEHARTSPPPTPICPGAGIGGDVWLGGIGARAAGGQLRPRDRAARARARAGTEALPRELGVREARPGLRLAGVHGDDLPPLGGRPRRPATTSRSGARRRPS